MQGSAPVKFFVSVITGDQSLREHAIHVLEDHLGKVDFISEWFPFSHTSFYVDEMGIGLNRSFVSFDILLPPENLPKVKLLTSKVENQFRKDGKRTINIDPGYIDHFKMVLASGKFAPHRLALTKGCYADYLLYYQKSKWFPLPWAFQDFANNRYDAALTEIRKLFKAHRAEVGA